MRPRPPRRQHAADGYHLPDPGRGNAVARRAVAELKRRPGRELQVHGSGVLVRSLLAERLVDAHHVLVFPVLLGDGRRLFTDGVPPARLRLTDSRTSGSGVTMQTYESAGAPAFGTV